MYKCSPGNAWRWLSRATAVFIACATAAWAEPDPNGANSHFSRSRHQFDFANSFQSGLWVDLPHFGRVDLASNSYGLCGGMIYAAHDSYWFESTTGRQTDTPSNTTVPGQGTRLRQYLWDRQLDSLKKDNWWAVRRLFDWMKKPLDDRKVGRVRVSKGLKTLSAEQFYGRIVPGIDKGWAIPLLMVNKSFGENGAFTDNHQVLAIGYRLHDLPNGKQEWDIRIYDPNCPTQASVLHTRSRMNSCNSVRFRGYFVSKYAGQKPYWAENDSRKWSGRKVTRFPRP